MYELPELLGSVEPSEVVVGAYKHRDLEYFCWSFWKMGQFLPFGEYIITGSGGKFIILLQNWNVLAFPKISSEGINANTNWSLHCQGEF